MKKRNWIISALLLAVLALLTTIYTTSPNALDKGYAADKAGDFKQAAKYYRIAAKQGHASAQYNLGQMYDDGQAVAQDYKQAVKYYRLAAEQGHASAQNNLGRMYVNGLGLAKNNKQAFKYFHLAAEQGNALAQHNLGYMYSDGLGVAQNNEQAVKYYRLAAAQGNASSKIMLPIVEAILWIEQYTAEQEKKFNSE